MCGRSASGKRVRTGRMGDAMWGDDSCCRCTVGQEDLQRARLERTTRGTAAIEALLSGVHVQVLEC